MGEAEPAAREAAVEGDNHTLATAPYSCRRSLKIPQALACLNQVDDDAYYARAGSYSPGKGADETGYTGFIHLTGQVDWVWWPLRMNLADFAVKLEGKPSFIKRALSTWGDVSTFRTTDPNYHLIMESFQRRLVHDALALGRATKRKVSSEALTHELAALHAHALNWCTYVFRQPHSFL